VIASLGQSLFEFVIKFVSVIILCFVFQYVPAWPVVFVPLAVLPLIFLTLGLSFFLSLVNGVLRDTANIVGFLTTFLMFWTPIFYPVPDEKYFWFKLNPLAPLVSAPRDLMVYGSIRSPEAFFAVSVFSVLLFLMSWRIFHLVETKIPERI
jgi:lipopolysaccharide transport system permease protein